MPPVLLDNGLLSAFRGEQSDSFVFAGNELNAALCPNVIALERSCPWDLVMHRSSLFRVTYTKGTLLKDSLSSDVG